MPTTVKSWIIIPPAFDRAGMRHKNELKATIVSRSRDAAGNIKSITLHWKTANIGQQANIGSWRQPESKVSVILLTPTPTSAKTTGSDSDSTPQPCSVH